jgi:nitrogen fixation/metabolism regulation signal transduction histidine kinase
LVIIGKCKTKKTKIHYYNAFLECPLAGTSKPKYLKDKSIVRLSIKDNGDGFDESVLESVFEPYVTTNLTNQTQY